MLRILLRFAGICHNQHRSSCTEAQLDLFRCFGQMDSHRYPLGQADPLEGRADIGQKLKTGAPRLAFALAMAAIAPKRLAMSSGGIKTPSTANSWGI
jgi:hypothetical protein